MLDVSLTSFLSNIILEKKLAVNYFKTSRRFGRFNREGG